MAPGVQVKLLRVLQEKVYEPLGGVEPQETDVRVIAATNRDLDEAVTQGDFRRDLFYRLNVVRIAMPPLRERLEDIPLLVAHFVARFNRLTGKAVQGASEDTLCVLMRLDYPGNVRELENILEYAFILCPGGFIQVEHLPEHLHPAPSTPPDGPMTMEAIKRAAARAALARHEGKRMAACRELGITKDTLRRLLDDMDE